MIRQHHPRQDKATHQNTRQSKTRRDKTIKIQAKTRQPKARQDYHKTRQDSQKTIARQDEAITIAKTRRDNNRTKTKQSQNKIPGQRQNNLKTKYHVFRSSLRVSPRGGHTA
jgi:hypothetical protein